MDSKIIRMYRVKKYLKILLLTLFLFLIGLFVYSYTKIKPNNVAFTNTTSSSVTVSWTTNSAMEGLAMVVDAKSLLPISILGVGGDIFYDTRDVRKSELIATQETAENLESKGMLSISMSDIVTEVFVDSTGEYYTHHIELKGLEPETEYKVLIGDGILFVDTGEKIKTASVPESIPTPAPAYGAVKDAQGKEVTFDELAIVTDAIIYFNFYDEASDERSSVVSGVLNEEGNWYLDISMATDKEGDIFKDKYLDTASNKYGELVIDAGPLGIWEKRISLTTSAPADPIVLNDPYAISDSNNPMYLRKIGNGVESSLIKGISANSCDFEAFCGPCWEKDSETGLYTEICPCSPETLVARRCTVDAGTQEAVTLLPDQSCYGGAVEGALTFFEGECRQCNGVTGLWQITGYDVCENAGVATPAVFNPEQPETPPVETPADNEALIMEQKRICNEQGGSWDDSLNECKYRVYIPIVVESPTQQEEEIMPKPLTIEELKELIPATLIPSIGFRLTNGDECLLEDPGYCMCYTTDYKIAGKPIIKVIYYGETCSSGISTPSGSFMFKFNPIIKVLAQENDLNYQEYVIDQENSSINLLTPGEYLFEYDGEMYFIKVNLNQISATNGNIPIYIDTDGNEQFDELNDIKISELGSVLKVATISQTYVYNLKQGYNFITIPFIPLSNELRTAAGLLSSFNSRFSDSIYSISKYDSNWKMVGQNTELYDNNDFQLIPGQGYIIKAKRDLTIDILGQPVLFESTQDAAPILLSKGWNLIGLYGTNVKQYTAKTLIQGINSYSKVKFNADNVSRWESDVQKYEGYQLTNENGVDIEYGFDYPINLLQSYFLRVIDGKGSWQPELKD